MAESQRADWTITNIWYLALMTFGYIFGEIAHFLINTTSKEVARGKKDLFFLLSQGSQAPVYSSRISEFLYNIANFTEFLILFSKKNWSHFAF